MEKRILKERTHIVYGAPVKVHPWTGRKSGHIYSEADILKGKLDWEIKNATNYDDLNKIGSLLAYAKDNDVDVGQFDYTHKASKKMREIYDKLGEYQL